ncbi:MAG: FHA domain-containing protein [Planctomycetota bacterium]
MSRIQEALSRASRQRLHATAPRLELVPAGVGASTEAHAADGDFIFVGRGPTNDVAFDLFDDVQVSVRHAGIRREERDWVLYDMGSLNGTFLNDAPVDRAVLHAGDEIGFGRTGPRLVVTLEDLETVEPPAAGAPTMPVLDAGSLSATAESPIVFFEEEDELPARGVTRPVGRRRPHGRTLLLAAIAAALAVKIVLDLVHVLS